MTVVEMLCNSHLLHPRVSCELELIIFHYVLCFGVGVMIQHIYDLQHRQQND